MTCLNKRVLAVKRVKKQQSVFSAQHFTALVKLTAINTNILILSSFGHHDVRGKMILPPYGKEFFHVTVSSFLHCSVRTFLYDAVTTFLHRPVRTFLHDMVIIFLYI